MANKGRWLQEVDESPESKLLRAVFDYVRRLPELGDFKPWMLLDTPSLAKFAAFGAWSAVVQPLGLGWNDNHEISSQDVRLTVGLSFFLPYEDVKEIDTTPLYSLRLGRFLATKMYSKESYKDPTDDPRTALPMNIAVTEVRPMQPIQQERLRILTWSVELLMTLDPRTARIR